MAFARFRTAFGRFRTAFARFRMAFGRFLAIVDSFSLILTAFRYRERVSPTAHARFFFIFFLARSAQKKRMKQNWSMVDKTGTEQQNYHLHPPTRLFETALRQRRRRRRRRRQVERLYEPGQ